MSIIFSIFPILLLKFQVVVLKANDRYDIFYFINSIGASYKQGRLIYTQDFVQFINRCDKTFMLSSMSTRRGESFVAFVS